MLYVLHFRVIVRAVFDNDAGTICLKRPSARSLWIAPSPEDTSGIYD